MDAEIAEFKRIEMRWKSDVDLKLDRVDARVRTIERLVWIATGGVIVLGTVSMIGVSILRDFSNKLEGVSNAQAASAAETRVYDFRTEELRREVERLRSRGGK